MYPASGSSFTRREGSVLLPSDETHLPVSVQSSCLVTFVDVEDQASPSGREPIRLGESDLSDSHPAGTGSD